MIKTIALFETDIQAYAQLSSRRIGTVCIYPGVSPLMATAEGSLPE